MTRCGAWGCGGEGAEAVASAHGERPGSTHKVAEVQCSRNTRPDPEQPHALPPLRAACHACAIALAPYPFVRRRYDYVA
ncbi:unnamed protein product, partial [Brenthis ino]